MNTTLELLADRHFRPDPQGVLPPKGAGRRGRVLVTVAQSQASTPAGQHLAWMLVNQLARQFGVVAEIVLDAPIAPLLQDTAAFGARTDLLGTLEACVRLVAGNHVGVSTALQDRDEFDLHVVVGAATEGDRASRTLCTYADGWRWYVGSGKHIPAAIPSSSLNFGPYLAASFAGGEVFKSLRGMLPNKGEYISECFGSAWSMALAETWESLVDGPSLENIPALGHFYFAGAGAVAQAAALTLGASRIRGSATAIDHDRLEITNDNRYVLSTIEDEGTDKVDILSSYLSRKGFPCHPAPVKWSEYVGAMGRIAANAEIAALERQYHYPLVLSCVDKNRVRHEIQALLPRVIIGGSTDGLVAKTQVYYLAHEASCLKCFNPIEDRNQIIQRNREELRAMTPEQRNEWCRERKLSIADLERFLAPSGCGKLSESDLERFADGPADMSVGFVSVTAGVLLAAQLVRLAQMDVDLTTSSGHLVAATFARAGMRHLKSGPDAKCDCQARMRERWRRLWGA